MLLSGAGMCIELINPYLAKLIIDKAYANKDLKLFIIFIAIAGAIFILNGAFNGLSEYLNRYIRLRLSFDLNRKIFVKLQSLPYSFFQAASTGQHLYKISYDIEQAGYFIVEVLPKAVSLLPKSLFILAIVFYLDWKIALFALALMPFLYFVPLYFTKRLMKLYQAYIENSQSIFSKLQETFSHIYLIKAFGKEKEEIIGYIRRLVKNTKFNFANIKLELTSIFAGSLANRIILGLIIFYGGCQVIKGKMTLGALSAITIYLSQLSGLQSSLAQFFHQISLGLVSFKRLEAILDAEALELMEDKQPGEIIFPKGRIQFRNITFGYEQDKPFLKDLTFCIEGGSCVGLVGYSGCGKTTLINLILRFYPLSKGGIFIDGFNINMIKSKSFYGQIGVALQEPYLWNDVIGANIGYGKAGAGLKDIAEAARIACIDNFVSGLREGYDTVIGENACKISEGQKQRIAVARALIKRPRILILDEALSSVDGSAEDRIINNIKSEFSDSTVIIITHRLSTMEKLDLIYFLSAPDKIAIGTHEELLKNNMEYQSYFSAQLKEDGFKE